MKRSYKILAVILLITLVLSACGGSSVNMMETKAGIAAPGDAMAGFESPDMMQWATNTGSASTDSYYDSGYNDYEDPSAAPETPPMDAEDVHDSEMKIIKTGDMSIQTKTFDETDAYIKAETEKHGGLLTDRSVSGTPGYRSAYYTVRIPAENFDEFFFKISGAWTVTNQEITSEDVTEQYSDLELQLETNEAKHARLLILLDKAESLEDIYSIQTELSQVEYEINSIKGTLNHMTSRISYSTITISVREVDSEPVVDDGSFWSALTAALSNGWSSFTDNMEYFVLDLAYELPNLIFYIIVLTIVIVVIVRVRRWLKRKQIGSPFSKHKAKKEKAEEILPEEKTNELDDNKL